ncbi:hypothetical protein [Streptomyces vinaceus]|uniref:hypothetical protein n=1 Tax=Streptomyces vinaceus TaxID=1960 RepID=UPI003817286F
MAAPRQGESADTVISGRGNGTAYEDRTYHGIQRADSHDEEFQPTRLLVETPEEGPTPRGHVKVLRELPKPKNSGGFGWGYNGTATALDLACR